MSGDSSTLRDVRWPALEMRGVSKRFPAWTRSTSGSRGAARRGARAARRERRRQVDADEDPQRRLPRGRGRDPHRRPGRSSPRPARRQALGIRIIYQELNLVPQLRWPRTSSSAASRRPLAHDRRAPRLEGAAGAARRSRLAVDPDTPVSELSVAQQQMVEIAKALCARAAHPHHGRADLGAHRRETTGSSPPSRRLTARRRRDHLHLPPARGGESGSAIA